MFILGLLGAMVCFVVAMGLGSGVGVAVFCAFLGGVGGITVHEILTKGRETEDK